MAALTLRTDDYGSERLYGPKRYAVFLRMLSKEVDDVMVQKMMPLDVLTSRVPHCFDASAGSCTDEGDYSLHVQPGSGIGIYVGFDGCQKGTGSHRLLHRTRGAHL